MYAFMCMCVCMCTDGLWHGAHPRNGEYVGCLCVCVSVCMYVSVYVCVYMHYTFTYVHTHTNACMRRLTNVSTKQTSAIMLT